jgi:hypothetical protein
MISALVSRSSSARRSTRGSLLDVGVTSSGAGTRERGLRPGSNLSGTSTGATLGELLEAAGGVPQGEGDLPRGLQQGAGPQPARHRAGQGQGSHRRAEARAPDRDEPLDAEHVPDLRGGVPKPRGAGSAPRRASWCCRRSWTGTRAPAASPTTRPTPASAPTGPKRRGTRLPPGFGCCIRNPKAHAEDGLRANRGSATK